MHLREITIRELPSFLESELYKGSQVLPLTPERAASQMNNPRALPDDTILVVAYTDAGQLAGFAGMLPDTAYCDDGPFRFAWNSGWWVDKELGKGLALPLFYRSVQACKGNYMITYLTPHTRKIMELTRLFYFTDPVKAVRLQILSDMSGKVRRNVTALKAFTMNIAILDRIVNVFLRGRLQRWIKARKNEVPAIAYMEYPDRDSMDFMERHNQGELCRRGPGEFEWITSFPWLVSRLPYGSKKRYPFSWQSPYFSIFWAKILVGEDIAGIVMLSGREGLFKIPYAYAERGSEARIASGICRIMWEKKAKALYTARKEIIEYLERNAFPVLNRRYSMQELAVSKTISHRHPERFFLQDGDGDAVFT